MKLAPLIDAKGRLFGRLNVVDLGVVTLIVVMGYGVFITRLILSGELRRPPPATAATIAPVTVRVNVMLRELDRERIEQIRVGDSQRGEGNREVATILALGRPQPDFFDVGFGNLSIEASHPTFLRLLVVMRLIGEARGGAFFFQGRLIGHGSTIVFHPPQYRVTGMIVTAFPLSGYTLEVERKRLERTQ